MVKVTTARKRRCEQLQRDLSLSEGELERSARKLKSAIDQGVRTERFLRDLQEKINDALRQRNRVKKRYDQEKCEIIFKYAGVV